MRPAAHALATLCALGGLLIAATAQSQGPPASQVPDSIRPPAGETLVLHAHGTGVQIYVCQAAGKAAAHVDSPMPGSIPWLLISATGHSGVGILSRVTSVQRIHTRGGMAPAARSCDRSKLGQESRSAYSADYNFYSPAR